MKWEKEEFLEAPQNKQTTKKQNQRNKDPQKLKWKTLTAAQRATFTSGWAQEVDIYQAL